MNPRASPQGGSAMPEIKTEFLFKITLEVPPVLDVGETPYGRRRIARVAGGSFEGPKLKGEVLPGGGDWLLLRRDGVLQLDVRLTLETDDKQMIYMTYKGFRHGPKDVIDRLNRGEAVDAGLYYFRTTPYFETSSDKSAWMNSLCCVASGPRSSAGPTYHVCHGVQGWSWGVAGQGLFRSVSWPLGDLAVKQQVRR